VVGAVEAPSLPLDLPLDVRGTVLQQRVWRALREFPAGSTATYTEIAQRIGAPKAVRAVAKACAANALAIAIPCHRVVRNDGSLSGYRWGVKRKRALLAREAASRSASSTGRLVQITFARDLKGLRPTTGSITTDHEPSRAGCSSGTLAVGPALT
jgi:AraC family transcriptional regulator, regulatory protein of adaptative response / methylated-DNA-[protein]-cysteine methyltransferase